MSGDPILETSKQCPEYLLRDHGHLQFCDVVDTRQVPETLEYTI